MSYQWEASFTNKINGQTLSCYYCFKLLIVTTMFAHGSPWGWSAPVPSQLKFCSALSQRAISDLGGNLISSSTPWNNHSDFMKGFGTYIFPTRTSLTSQKTGFIQTAVFLCKTEVAFWGQRIKYQFCCCLVQLFKIFIFFALSCADFLSLFDLPCKLLGAKTESQTASSSLPHTHPPPPTQTVPALGLFLMQI